MRRRLVIGALALVVVVLPLVLRSPYFIHIAVMSFLYVMLAQSLNLVLGYCGLLSLASPAFFGIGAYVGALAAFRLGWDTSFVVCGSAIAGAIAGAAIGYPSLRTSGYGDNTVLHGVELVLAVRTWTTIIGANGAGKSTLLKAIAGVVPVRSGSVLFEGRDITSLNAIQRLRAGIGHVPQGRCNFPLLTVAENLRLGAYTRNLNESQFRSESGALVERFQRLKERWDIPAGNLSGGEQQMLEMAMVLMARPHLLLLDEPSLGLAPGAMQAVFAMARSLADEGMTLLMVEQNARQALEHCDVGVVLDLGRVSLVEPASRVLEHADIRRSFLGV